MTRGDETEGLTSTPPPPLAVRLETGGSEAPSTRIDLDSGTITVGTGSSADWKLSDRSVSRLHASIEVLGGGVRVKDLWSRNGTHYLGARIETAIVPVGGTIVLGRCTIHVLPGRDVASHEATADAPASLVGTSKVMRRLFAKLNKIAAGDATVLIEGETGTGKDAFARAIHERSGLKGSFVVFDCASVNANLIEAELYGVARGAFSGAERARAGLLDQALEGTLLIDEPASLAPELQTRLLRVLESREFRRVGENLVRRTSARFIATSQVPLEHLVEAGRFRADLYYRLSAVRISLPPLSERREDIPLLAAQFAQQHGTQLPMSTLVALQCHHWPGNLRELKSAIERTVLQLNEPLVTPQRLSDQNLSFLEAREQLLSHFEREFLSALVARHQGNVSAAAREAKVARSFFYRLLQKHGLSSP